jgi:hypothetical protein
MTFAGWPVLHKTDRRRCVVEIMASFPDRGVWRNEPPGEPYHSVYAALFNSCGAVRLFRGKVNRFSQPTFFSCAYPDSDKVFVMLDAETMHLLDRCSFSGRRLEAISIRELTDACSKPGTRSGSAREYRKWCDLHAQDDHVAPRSEAIQP